MKFQATKCDECGRIQGESNHWVQVRVWSTDQGCVGVAFGSMAVTNGAMAVSDQVVASTEIHDLCGQGCAFRHIGKLLGWSQTPTAEVDTSPGTLEHFYAVIEPPVRQPGSA